MWMFSRLYLAEGSLDPDLPHVDVGHCGLALRQHLSDAEREVRHAALGRSKHSGALEVEVRLRERRDRLADLRIVGARRPEGLFGLFEFGFGLDHDGFGGIERRLGLGPACFANERLS